MLALAVLILLSGSAFGQSQTETEDCGNGIDDDSDSLTDCDDSECGCHYDGYGSRTKGGEGGALLWIDATLGDPTTDSHDCSYSDPCSLRKAFLTSGPRVVKVKTGGTIELSSRLWLRDEHSYLTFDGFSAPSPGVTIRGNHQIVFVGRNQPTSAVHDIIINNLKIVYTGTTIDISLDGEHGDLYNYIFDSFTITSTSRSIENPKMVLWWNAENITVSNNLYYDVYKGLQLSTNQGGPSPEDINGVSIFNNVWYNVSHRQPILRANTKNVDVINNLMYNYYFVWTSDTVTRIKYSDVEDLVSDVNIINNYYYSMHSARNEQLRAVIYGDDHGPSDDGGPASCVSQGELVSDSNMGRIWISGNVIPQESCDVYSTVSSERPRPSWAQIDRVSATSLCSRLSQTAGMRYKNAREQEILDQIENDDCKKHAAGDQQQVYYVGQTNCDDSGPGSLDNPFCSLENAVENLVPDDTLYIRQGSYNAGTISVPSGEPGKQIRISNYQDETVHVRSSWNLGSSNRDRGFSFSGASHVMLEGIEISNFYDCMPVRSGSDDILLKDLIVHDCRSGIDIRDSSDITVDSCEAYAVSDSASGCGDGNDGHAGVAVRTSSDITIRDTASHDNYDGCGPSGDADGFSVSSGDNINIINCTAADNDEDGLDFTASTGSIINFRSSGHNACGIKLWKRENGVSNSYTLVNVISYDNEEAGIKISSPESLDSGSYDIKIYNSLFYDNGEYGIVARDFNPGIDNSIEIYNSIFLHNGYGNDYDGSCCYLSIGFGANTNPVADHNIYYDNHDGDSAWSGEGTNSMLGTDPMLTDPAGGDFSLLADSPAINNGMDSGYYSDIENNPRIGLHDIGPYESGSSCITEQEIISAISEWKSGSRTMTSLVAVILQWKNGC
jgi:hypothetical protein